MEDMSKTKKELIEELMQLRKKVSSQEKLQEEYRETQNAEEFPKDSEEQFKAVAQSANDAIISIDSRSNVILWNPAAEYIFGYSDNEVMGNPLPLIIPERLRGEHEEGLRRFLRTGESRVIGTTYESTGVRKDGSEFPVEISLSSWRRREAFFFTGIVRDITERKLAEKSLKLTADNLARSNTELEKFAYIASHDLKEPLRTITGFINLLEKRYKDKLDKDANDFIGFIVSGSKRMERLIDDLLSFSRVRVKEEEMGLYDLNIILKRTLENLSGMIGESRAQVNSDTLPTIDVNDLQMQQLFQNLIANALKFRGGEPPIIHVSASKDGDGWIFSVRDNGMGLKHEDRDRIFHMFQCLNNKNQYEGTGIGLAICKKIVELHGGRIWVESKPGEGSVFKFNIPQRKGVEK